jgi:hypothetical protein
MCMYHLFPSWFPRLVKHERKTIVALCSESSTNISCRVLLSLLTVSMAVNCMNVVCISHELTELECSFVHFDGRNGFISSKK